MSDTLVALVRVEAEGAVRAEDSLEDRFRAAMKAARGHWMVLDEEKQYQGAIEAVYISASDEEKERIETELRQLQTLAALLNGVPIDMDRIEPLEDAIRIRALWEESR